MAASVEAGERLRLFCGLPVPREAHDALVSWQREALHGDLRPVASQHLHFTLAFLGHRPAGEVEAVRGELREAAAGAGRPTFVPLRYRETRSVGMVVFDDIGGVGAELADDLQRRLAALGVYRPEDRPWLPHVTVCRFRSPPRLRPRAPELGEVSPSDAALYHSVLRSGGAQYEIIESVALGG